MPERWRAELDRLGTLTPSGELWKRAQLPPAGGGTPPRRQRVVAGVVAVVVFLGAAAFAWRAWTPRGTSARVGGAKAGVVVDLHVVGEGSASRPAATLTVAGRVIQGTPSSYCWSYAGGNRCLDMIGPVFKRTDFVDVTRGALLHVSGDAGRVLGLLTKPPISYSTLQRMIRLGTITGPVALKAPEGSWVLDLRATWQQGTLDFYFPVEIVVAPRGTSTRQGLLDCPKSDQVAFRRHSRFTVTPGGVAFIRGNTVGMRRSDLVHQMHPGTPPYGWGGRWLIIRGGARVGWVDFRTLDGVACRGSGIGGV
jgi:hypothetical protein